MTQPLIGILPLYDTEKESYWMLPGYMQGIEDAGGIPVMLPLTTSPATIAALARSFDGFLFTGGHDVNPRRYGESQEAFCGELCEARDEMEARLFEEVLALDKPAFGICRGLQLFNVLLGGTLYQDLPTQRTVEGALLHKQSPPYSEPAHLVHISQGTLLYDIVKQDSVPVNSYHHQGIKQLAAPLTAVAVAEDGLIEGVTLPDKKFVLAVQWHPEFSYRTSDFNFALLKSFVRQASR
ncbi:gamma-glutamyl-gamma-aminobutyrate hydrolase family protein [Paenibacillus ferrarius]|uniref:gamma-glutamyl-gamma-aminobutyrate hydrolase family protein n=1 Tax=Paenibacillus ferrarius TaxID=1469647 RepID=UPI003D26CDE1